MQAINKEPYDVAIIGAGPAGCAAALGLGRSGLKVALIDKDKFPRDKTCGDAIPGPAIKTLDNAFPFFDKEFKLIKKRQPITSSRIILQSKRSIDYQWTLPAYNIKRTIFDKFLFDLVKKYANTEIFTEFKAEKVLTGTPHFISSQENSLQAKLIIGSYGTSESLLLPATSYQPPVFALRAYYSGLNLNATTNFFYIINKFLPGYFWIFPLAAGEYNVGFGMKTGRDGKAGVNMKEALDEFIQSPRMKKVFANSKQLSAPSGAYIPAGGKKQSYSGDGYLLAGDAANLADPLQGHGIDKAIVSGLLAAHHAKKSFQSNDLSADSLSAYDLSIATGIERELRKNYRKMKIINRFPFLLNFAAGTKS